MKDQPDTLVNQSVYFRLDDPRATTPEVAERLGLSAGVGGYFPKCCLFDSNLHVVAVRMDDNEIAIFRVRGFEQIVAKAQEIARTF